jgi:dTDP-4-dehydrorhamnose reductase
MAREARMATVLILGASGMLGSDVVAAFEGRGRRVIRATRNDFDLGDVHASAEFARGAIADGAQWCVNCAAYTNVDAAESEEETAHRINALGPESAAREFGRAGLRFLQISTDYVFDGRKGAPYGETDAVHPLGAYARSKLLGDRLVLAANPSAVIARTAWLFGPNGSSFPKSMIHAWRENRPLRVVEDQWGTPTYTADLAETIARMIESDIPPGVYHAAGPDATSRYDWALASLRAFEKCFPGRSPQITIERARLADWPSPAPRPSNTALDCSKLRQTGAYACQPLGRALEAFCARLGPNP